MPKKRVPHGQRRPRGAARRPAPIQVSLPPDHEQAQELAAAVRPVVDGCREAIVCLGEHCVRARQCSGAAETVL